MFAKLMPRESKFFDFFNAHANEVVKGAEELAALMRGFDGIEHRAYNIESAEKRADAITAQTVHLLHQTFITPLDRDEIHLLITRMDDILDLIEDVAQSIFLYDVKNAEPDAAKLADLCLASTRKVQAAVALISNMENADATLKICAEIDRLEAEADHVMRAAMAKLFRDEPDTRQVLKWKAIYELLEEATDRCEDVANIIEGIVLENS